ncbi:MAG: two-component system response regulator [bacterium]
MGEPVIRKECLWDGGEGQGTEKKNHSLDERGGTVGDNQTNEVDKKQYDVLVVDDEASVRRLIECLLKEVQYNTHHARSGDEALEILKKTSVDLIILDLLLPGQHGLNLCSKIREIDRVRNTPILVITAVYTKSKYCYKSKECGANGFMTKPFDVDAFMNEVNRLMKIEKAPN